jgi:hypothetical protein
MKSKKQKKVFSPTLSNVTITPVAQKGDPTAGESLKDFRRRYDAEQAAAKQAPINQAIAQLSQTMQELNRHAREFWGQSLGAIIPQLYSELSKDCVLSVPAIRDQFTLDDVKAAFDIWFEQMPKTGYDFATEVAAQKFVRYLLAQAKHGHDVSNPAAVQTCWERCLQLEMFADGDLTFDPSKAPRPVAAPAPRATLADIEKLNISGDAEQAKQAKQIVTNLMYDEVAPLHRAFMEHLRDTYGFTPSEDGLRYLYNVWFPRSNKSYLIHSSYDAARRHMVSIGRWPDTLLTDDERVAREIEQGPALGTLSFDQRWNMMAKVQRQRKKD